MFTLPNLPSARTRTVRTLFVDFKSYYRSTTFPTKVPASFEIEIDDSTFLPNVDEPTADWVSMIATPAFKAYKELRPNKVKKFATVGTGSGLDAIIASEIYDLELLAITDLHRNVVATAARNVLSGLGSCSSSGTTIVFAAYGDLLSPLSNAGVKFDLVYENLPNIPIEVTEDEITQGQTSAIYLEERKEKLPPIVQTNFLALHFLAIKQAAEFLAPGGHILSCIGGRVPISVIVAIACSAGQGVHAQVHTYTWKEESEPEAIGGYVHYQKKGFGPFYWYPVEVLEELFCDISAAEGGDRAYEIEAKLEAHKLDAVAAYSAYKRGAKVGHTVLVIRSSVLEGRTPKILNFSENKFFCIFSVFCVPSLLFLVLLFVYDLPLRLRFLSLSM